MVDPLLALGIFAAAAAVIAILVWPKRGILPRLAVLLRLTERVRIEDALKHIYMGEYESRTPTLASIAGALSITRGRAVQLLARLEASRLIGPPADGIRLTDEGRSYALRILRSHRLWERFLADRTNVDPGEWHEEAERREHTLTPEQTEGLASRMGHPRYDPHGDPIPTADGELPPQSGVPLTSLAAGQTGTVSHIEDEPKEVYHEILAAGLAPQMQLELLDESPETVRFRADGHELTLAPVVASNITVKPAAVDAPPSEGPVPTLLSLEPGDTGVVRSISPVCQGPHRRRLLDLGLVPGTPVRAEMRSALGDPVAYRIRGALIALRRHQAEWVQVEPQDGGLN